MATFEEILNKPMSEIKDAPRVPVGTYLALTLPGPKFGKSSQKKTDYVDFGIRLLQPTQDVDPQALAEYGPLDAKDIWPQGGAGRNGLRYYLSEPALPMIKAFCVETLGMDEATGLKEAISNVPGHQFYVTFRHVPSDDGKRFFSEVATTARA